MYYILTNKDKKVILSFEADSEAEMVISDDYILNESLESPEFSIVENIPYYEGFEQYKSLIQ